MADKKEVSVVVSALNKTKEGLDQAKHHVKEFSGEVKTLLAEAFAGFTVFEFFKSAIEKSTEAEQTAVQLSNTLANVGVNYEKNKEHIEAMVKSLQKVANVETDNAIKGFNTLVQRSGDYTGSMKNMVLVADLAKAKHLEFNDAAELVGRVMGGNTKVLKQFGIVTKDAHDGIAQLTERLHGAAAADMATFGGQVERGKIQFEEFLQSVGNVIIGNSSLSDSLKGVGEWIEKSTKWVEENHGALGAYFSAIVTGTKEAGRNLLDIAKIAFYGGQAIGSFFLALSEIKDKGARDEAFAAMKQSFTDMKDAGVDILGTFDRITVASERASQSEAAGVKRTDAELTKSAALNAQRLAERAQAEEDARQKKLDAENKIADDILKKEIENAGKVADLKGFEWRVERQQAIDMMAERIEQAKLELRALNETNASLDRRLEVEKRIADIHAAQKKLGVDTRTNTERLNDTIGGGSLSGADMVHQGLSADEGIVAAGLSLEKIRTQFLHFKIDASKLPHLAFTDALETALSRTGDRFRDATGNLREMSAVLGDIVAGPLVGFGEATASAFGAMIAGSKTAGQAFKQAMLSALGSVAKAEGDYMVARAFGGAAKGIGGNPLGFVEQAQWLLGAAAMYTVAGAASALASSVGGGGGGAGGVASSLAQAGAATQAQGTVTVHLKGSKFLLDANDPDSQDSFIEMVKKVAGNRNVDFVYDRNAA